MVLKNRKILLGVTGSVAVHKAVDLARRLTDEGASVHVVMTDAAKKFVAPLAFEVASQKKVHSDLFADP
ncbi:MAG: flavoprotein, partial [Thermodesulfovibrionales bacterium]